MLEATTTNATVLAAGTTLTFTSTSTETMSTVLDSGGQNIKIRAAGTYLVNFTGILTSNSAGTFTANLVVNGADSTRAFAATTLAAGDSETIGFATLVKAVHVPTGEFVTLNVSVSGANGTVAMGDIVVTKVA